MTFEIKQDLDKLNQLIIKEYTKETFYGDLNKWLMDSKMNSYDLIAYFTSRLMYSLNKYGEQNQKYYISDLGLRRYMVTKKNYDLGFSLENVVYLELKRRGYRINIGKVGSTEVDFVTEKNGSITYIQVTASMTDEKTFEREMAPLKTIKDNHPKMILTLDRFTAGNYEGITVENVIDWLLERV